MPKPREQITGWIYPCDGKMFYYDGLGELYITEKPKDSKKYLIRCGCYKNCKPKKIKIVVVEGMDDE